MDKSEPCLVTISMTYVNCSSRDWYENRIVRPNIENSAIAKASGSFWSNLLLQNRRGLPILPQKCW